MSRWRLLLTDPAGGPENMALDEALMHRARATGEWVLRVYSWSTPTLSIGRHQSARDAYDARTLGVDVEVAEQTRAPKPDLTPCFELPSTGELTAGGRKLAGSAQWREDGA